MDTPQAPAAPDPAATAAAQSASNKATAITQYGLNATNQVTPQGTLSYKQIGTWDDGTPRFEATQAYSPDQQGLYDKSLVTQNNLADIGNTASSKIGALLNTPFSVNSAIEDKIDKLGAARLDPQFQRDQSALETQLINKGVRPGSEAWNNAQTQFQQGKNDAYNQLYLQGSNQAYNQSIGERNQPINEITALLSGSQVSNPNYATTPTPGVAPTDVIGAQQQSLTQQNVGFNAQQTQNNAFMSGLFGLGSAGIGGWAKSDINAKENIELVGERGDGLHVIDFDYKPDAGVDGERHRGLIAQEVAQVYPHATKRAPDGSGHLMVNYKAIPGAGMFALGAA